MSKRYRTKPCEIEALQWTGENVKEIEAFCEGNAKFYTLANALTINTLEGSMVASVNDYIIKGLLGEFYPCRPEAFAKKYEVIESEKSCLDCKYCHKVKIADKGKIKKGIGCTLFVETTEAPDFSDYITLLPDDAHIKCGCFTPR